MGENYIESKTKTDKILKDFASTEFEERNYISTRIQHQSLSISSQSSSPLWSDKPLKPKLTSRPGAPLVAKMVKNLPAMQEIQVWSLGQEDPLEKGMATYSSILAWRIPWTEEPGRLQFMGSQRDMTEWLTLSSFFLPEAVGLRSSARPELTSFFSSGEYYGMQGKTGWNTIMFPPDWDTCMSYERCTYSKTTPGNCHR